MSFLNILSMVGGLALFLYGMHMLGEGLAKVGGGRLEGILEKLTSSRIKGVLVGAGVTALIQSSSATTVMVVGFVNSGIMKLSQAINIIMGANIGTTMTAWLLSLSSIDGSSLWIQLLKPVNFSPILAIIGVFIIMFSKNEKKKDVATILVGFAILMMGMSTMSSAVEPLADVPEFTSILTMFRNPVLGMIAGAVITAIIQSSSASVGILQALCATGSVTYGTALPIIMGQNIGTCVTALLSAVGASRNAKRAALVHFYFNLIGTVVFMSVFYAVNFFVDFAFLNDTVGAANIAVIHSAFNIAATIVLLPFADQLGKLACLTIPDEKEAPDENLTELEKNVRALDRRFLDMPGYALVRAKSVSLQMAITTCDTMTLAMEQLRVYDEDAESGIEQLEREVYTYEDEIGRYLYQLAARTTSREEGHRITVLQHCIYDFERIAEHAMNVGKSAQLLYEKKTDFSQQAIEELRVYTHAIQDIMDQTLRVFSNESVSDAAAIAPLEEVIRQMGSEMNDRHLKRLHRGECTIELGLVLAEITNNYERVANHCANIALYLIQMKEENFNIHSEDEERMREVDEEYQKRKRFYAAKYVLPQVNKGVPYAVMAADEKKQGPVPDVQTE
ncbi:MAG: Na/Pi cotransporter family protein [Lachnospiraceae bacterium]|nr:Na/Pi cotransporter family protein [Lachnospiraceae bacterium]